MWNSNTDPEHCLVDLLLYDIQKGFHDSNQEGCDRLNKGEEQLCHEICWLTIYPHKTYHTAVPSFEIKNILLLEKCIKLELLLPSHISQLPKQENDRLHNCCFVDKTKPSGYAFYCLLKKEIPFLKNVI